jgi:anti-sigma B factor antagonist
MSSTERMGLPLRALSRSVHSAVSAFNLTPPVCCRKPKHFQTRDLDARSSSARTVNNPASEGDLRITCEQRGKGSRAELSGRVTIDSSPEFRASLLRMLCVPACQHLEVNFSEVVYIDTSGIAVLMEVLKTARHLGKKFELSGLRGSPRYLFESTGLLSFFEEAPAPSN